MKSLKNSLKGIFIMSVIMILMMGVHFPAYGISDQESQVAGYVGFENNPEQFDFTGLWKKPPKSLEEITGGKIKEGMVITKDNVEGIKAELIELTGENIYDMVKKGMEMEIAPYKPWPVPKAYMEATVQNSGRAIIEEDGNLKDVSGEWWTGGEPFFELKKDEFQAGLKAWYNQIHVFDGDDFTHDWVLMQYVNAEGNIERAQSMSWDRLFLTSRETLDPKPTYHEKVKNIFFKELVYVQDRFELQGFGFLTYRYNDQNHADDSYVYIPGMRRVRRVTTEQRFESFVGSDCSVGDFRTLDVPVGQWNWRLVEVKPKLTTLFSCDYITENRNIKRSHPSTVGNKFPRMNWRLWPEVWVIEATPKEKKYCPAYSKKIVWVLGGCWKSGFAQAFDQQGNLWKTTQNYFYGYGDGKNLDLLSPYETDFYTYDHQIDHASPFLSDLPHRKFNVGFKPKRFSTIYLQNYGR